MGATEPVLLRVQGATKTFGSIQAVDMVDLELRIGESVGLIGPNGAGKSTFLSLLSGDQQVSAGRVSFEGRDISRVPAHARVVAGIARAAQIPQTFGRLSLRENVLLPSLFGARLPQREAEDWCREVLAMVGLDARPDVPAGALGLLDRKRLELAKAVAARPRLLLLDEIAAGLTEPEVETIMALVRRLQAGRAIVWVEHIPAALRGTCERLVVMDKGAKTHDGPFAEVWADRSLQEIYMGVPDDDISAH
ncbi:ABC transporter ATP-binding protein [Phaeobacter sp. HF9A]|uniref:ABC transporter ATP-binding protein n=1 Tax=Phaeobacter sp. HF9A TaxID=2721561 RepID=UPI001430EB6A|nr:ATP-binding cassette domain-containing protein [Phaeobacter sp. HF9A]NIZ12340.1 ATP-binding cassette domain-containing protein [Phaeobacter sp. HF9A]